MRYVKAKIVCLLVVCFLITFLAINTSFAATTMSATSTPGVLTENNLDGAVIHLTISGATFEPNVNLSDLTLNNAPNQSTAVSNINQLTSTQLDVTISYNNDHLDSNITTFSITVQAGSIVERESVTSNTIIIYSINSTAIATSNPYTLYSPCLDGSIITIDLTDDASYVSSIASSNFILNSAPTGLIISDVIRLSDKSAQLLLGFIDTSIIQDIPDFSITVLADSNTANVDIKSNNMIIKAAPDIDGNQKYISSGESYPTQIEIAGYNSRDNKVYINFNLLTTKNVISHQTASFKYFVNIYDNLGMLIGSYGSISSPQEVSAPQGMNQVMLYNTCIDVSSIPTSYRILIIVVNVDII